MSSKYCPSNFRKAKFLYLFIVHTAEMIPKLEKRKSGKDSTANNVGILKFFGRKKRIYLRARKMIATNTDLKMQTKNVFCEMFRSIEFYI